MGKPGNRAYNFRLIPSMIPGAAEDGTHIPSPVEDMEKRQERNDRTVGQEFVAWYNRKHGTRFNYKGRSKQAPTLVFRDGDLRLRVEVATVYYDAKDSQFKWRGNGHDPGAPRAWSRINFHTSLVTFINKGVREKCSAEYGTKCVLLIEVMPTLMTAHELRSLLKEVIIPENNPFEGIYMVGHFTNSRRFGPVELVVKKVA